MAKFDEIVQTYTDIKPVSNEIVLARNNPIEFYRILRRKFDGQNANHETYLDREKVQYTKGAEVTTAKYQLELIKKLSDVAYRLSPKDDHIKTPGDLKANLTDAPGFGSVRLSPPYEDPMFDRDYFEFLNALSEDDDAIYDFGGGLSPFLSFIDRGKKMLVDKSGIKDVVEPTGISYQDGDEFYNSLKNQQRIPGIIFCFHVLVN